MYTRGEGAGVEMEVKEVMRDAFEQNAPRIRAFVVAHFSIMRHA